MRRPVPDPCGEPDDIHFDDAEAEICGVHSHVQKSGGQPLPSSVCPAQVPVRQRSTVSPSTTSGKVAGVHFLAMRTAWALFL